MFRNYDIMCQCVEGRVFERMVACTIYVYHLLLLHAVTHRTQAMTTSVPKDSTYLNMIPYTLTHALMGNLDPGDGWKKLLMAVESSQDDGPPLDPDFKAHLEMCHRRMESPTEKLLGDLGQKGYRLYHLRKWLRAQRLLRAAALLEGAVNLCLSLLMLWLCPLLALSLLSLLLAVIGFSSSPLPIPVHFQVVIKQQDVCQFRGQNQPPLKLGCTNLRSTITVNQVGSGGRGKTIQIPSGQLRMYRSHVGEVVVGGREGGTIELGSDVAVGFDSTRKPEVGASKSEGACIVPNRSEESGASESPSGPEGAVAKESVPVCIETATPGFTLPF